MKNYRNRVLWFVLATVLFSVSAEPLLKNGTFQEGSDGWKLPKPYRVENSSGRNGTVSLAYERKSPSEYPLASQAVQLESGKRYHFSAWVKTEGVKNGAAAVCLEYFKKSGLWGGGIYPEGMSGTTDWTLVEGTILMPLEVSTNARLSLYLSKGATGKVWFDDVKLIPDDQIRCNMYLIDPVNERLSTKDGRVRIRVYIEGDKPEKIDGLLSLSVAGIQRKFKVAATNGVLAADLGKLPEGKAQLQVKLFSKGREIAEASFVLMVVSPVEKLPANACMIDQRGRAIVGGKPYLPVGLYVRNTCTNEVDKIAQSPFNCLMPYHSKNLRLDADDTPSIKTINAALDYCYGKGIKIIFSTKDFYPWLQKNFPQSWMGATGSDAAAKSMVENFRTHPALLAWYINDEAGEDKVGKVVERRRMVNNLDPFHPTWGVLYQFEVLPMYGGTCDIMGVDPYPLEEPGVNDMKRVDFAFDMVDQTAMHTWVVPQAFNFGVYKAPGNPEKFAKYRNPSEEEMRSYSILSALRGAKGFVFYSYFDITKPPLTQANYDEFWPQLCRVGQMLRDLEPFLLSNTEPVEPDLEVKEGDVQAMEFHDADGGIRILVAGVGPGTSRAIIRTSPGTKFRSLYGHCSPAGDGLYEFCGEGACSDILVGK